MQIPLFPLHTVLSPGLALPLHVFEDRYRLMVRRCLDESTPFGVVLIHEGSELAPRDGGPQELAIASVGTFAEIREASRYADGRWELLTVGAGRFVIETVKTGLEPYLVADVEPLDDALGDADSADALVRRVSRRFVDYLRLLQPRDGEATTPIDVQVEVDVPDDDEADSDVEAFDAGLGVIGAQGLRDDAVQDEDSAAGGRRTPAMGSRRRCVDDPSHLSFLLTESCRSSLISRRSCWRRRRPSRAGELASCSTGADALRARHSASPAGARSRWPLIGGKPGRPAGVTPHRRSRGPTSPPGRGNSETDASREHRP
jgi:Lon protease-like protein